LRCRRKAPAMPLWLPRVPRMIQGRPQAPLAAFTLLRYCCPAAAHLFPVIPSFRALMWERFSCGLSPRRATLKAVLPPPIPPSSCQSRFTSNLLPCASSPWTSFLTIHGLGLRPSLTPHRAQTVPRERRVGRFSCLL